ncbi:MAG: hypothetical protein EKK31_11815 [Hyphomicrobiales bacterium]|nr:MAG: hypothetical protein EKK31_11815 [Hyphomicrobiales bacterium]
MATNHPGFGVMIGMLGGNADTVKAHQSAMNKIIATATVANDTLTLTFLDGSILKAVDSGQSCCEHRYMVCDDDLAAYAGSVFTGMEIRDAPNEPDDYGEHEVQFLYVNTSNGPFHVASHNEHNGYYGGFWITLNYEPA